MNASGARTLNLVVVLLALVLAACGQAKGSAALRQGDSSIAARDSASTARDSELVALRAIVWQRDRAVTDVRELAKLVAQIDSEVARAQDISPIIPTEVACEDDVECAQSQFRQLRTQVRMLVDRLALTQTRFRAAARANEATTAEDSLLRAQTSQLQALVNRLADAAGRQVLMLDSLRTRVDRMEQDSSVQFALRARLDSVTAGDDSVFLMAAPKTQLLMAGAVQERGGTLLTLGLGKTLVPVGDPPPRGWQVLSKKRDTVLMLPHPGKWYSVVSPHPVSLLRAERSDKDLRSGTVRIITPSVFWSSSRYLILQEH